MIQNIEGKLRNIMISKNNGVFSLFEAIMNSIQSIEEFNKVNNKDKDGDIDIFIERENTLDSTLER